MKKRNREINIFSMSALDLFASAMGAFMLLALVYLVFFTMTSRSPVAQPEPPEPVDCPVAPPLPEPTPCPVVPDTKPLEDALAACRLGQAEDRQRTAACEADNAELNEQVDQLEFPHLDLVVALDVTGSMTGPLDGLKNEIDQLMDVMSKMAPSFAIGIVAFGDRRWGTPVYHYDLLEVKHSASNRALLKRAIGGLEDNMGLGWGSNPDLPEAVLQALSTAVASSWRAEADRQIVVVVTDNPAYESERVPALEVARSFASSHQGRAVSAVFVATGGGSRAASAFLRNLATAGGGHFRKGRRLDDGQPVAFVALEKLARIAGTRSPSPYATSLAKSRHATRKHLCPTSLTANVSRSPPDGSGPLAEGVSRTTCGADR